MSLSSAPATKSPQTDPDQTSAEQKWGSNEPLILVYTPIATGELKENLGKPEYSYQFVLRHFMPVLRQLGDVVEVSDPAHVVDPIYRARLAKGLATKLLIFAPPNKSPVGLQCPTATVFAWEFDNLPDEVWDDDPRNDWRVVLRDHGRAIVLSNHTREVVQAALGEDYLVRAIPAPIFDRRPHGGVGTKRPQNQAREIRVAGEIVDSRHFVISPDAMEHKHPELFSRGDLGSENVHLSFDLDSDDRGYLVGFYTAEAFGSWSRIPEPWVMLPFTVSQPVKLTLVLGAYGPNVDRTITVSLGGDSHEIRLTSEAQTVAFTFHPSEPSNVLRFQTLDITPVPGAEDVRTMGISLCTLDVSPVPVVIPARRRAMARLRTLTRSAEKSELQPADKASLTLDGVVFTCVLNPVDGRKNWRDIVTAFCFAMRDNPNATLVLKMTHHSIASFFAELQLTLYRIGQVQCRVVAIRGFLEDEDYDRLLQATSFYINASLAEGLCMPLMEYMSGGVPAIAARNTAMLDYAYPESTFLVESSPQMTSWPHDTRFMLRTRYHQVNWESLVQAIRDSYEVAESDPARYQEMCQAATDVQASFCSDAVVSAALREALDLDQDL